MQTVTIYEDPLTREREEGQAFLVQKVTEVGYYGHSKEGNKPYMLECWMVDFDDGMGEVYRNWWTAPC